MSNYSLGDVVKIALGGTIGHEQKGERPCVVVAYPQIGIRSLGLIIVVPLTKKERGWWTMVRIEKGDGGVKDTSFAMCHQIRTISEKRILEKWGRIGSGTLGKIKTVLANIFEWTK